MLPELKTFIAVANYGTFSAAGERIGLTQAAVSGHIKRLEAQLGFALFDRSGHSAKLNAAGYRTLSRAQAIVRLVDALGDPEEAAPARALRIGAIGSVRATMLDRALALFGERYPAHPVHVVPGVSLHLLDRFDNRELDLAVMIRPPFSLPVDANWTTIVRDPYALVVPDTCDDDNWRNVLQTWPLLGYDRLSFSGRQVDRFLRGLPFAVTETPEVAVTAMVATVARGEGVALVPFARNLLPLPPGVRALPMHSKDLFREVGVVTSRERAIEPMVNYLKECFVEVAGGRASPRAPSGETLMADQPA